MYSGHDTHSGRSDEADETASLVIYTESMDSCDNTYLLLCGWLGAVLCYHRN